MLVGGIAVGAMAARCWPTHRAEPGTVQVVGLLGMVCSAWWPWAKLLFF